MVSTCRTTTEQSYKFPVCANVSVLFSLDIPSQACEKHIETRNVAGFKSSKTLVNWDHFPSSLIFWLSENHPWISQTKGPFQLAEGDPYQEFYNLPIQRGGRRPIASEKCVSAQDTAILDALRFEKERFPVSSLACR